ncbi:MerR family transcriptional regulator (plasmid) [Deinococcus wulumuqiensis]|uniref:citrate synthase (unknown stereospecificity) n=1 Tax=Deinococcus wulumuqiensis TaxID=980427 RepID=A0A345ILR5_9DEIO|nr:citrate/2-methylcitrate synthase [Deinococcus wulumuqiensis]AXH00638.1 MerR family transcriptional regulator [Deinococcus wulumuqiensis]
MSLTTSEACAQLGVKPATLYAYVSRGLVRSEPGPSGTRERRYNASDVAELVSRQALRKNPSKAALEARDTALGGALNWGAPILESALTRLEDGVLSYRGRDVRELAGSATVEEIAGLLWTGNADGWQSLPMRARLNLSAQPRATLPAEALAYALTYAATHDISALDSRTEALHAQAARVLNLLYATLERHYAIPAAPDLPLHQRLARAWGVREAQQVNLLRRALVLLADHELNVSAFAARVTASGGASLHHATLSALCALQGPRHGLAVLDTYELLVHASNVGARSALRDAVRRHGHLPGFGHKLYSAGDLRAASLLEALQEVSSRHVAVRTGLELCQEAEAETGDRPNIDLALAVLMHSIERPASDGVTLFALSRAVGWLAHAVETVVTGQMIRPRARYVGA